MLKNINLTRHYLPRRESGGRCGTGEKNKATNSPEFKRPGGSADFSSNLQTTHGFYVNDNENTAIEFRNNFYPVQQDFIALKKNHPSDSSVLKAYLFSASRQFQNAHLLKKSSSSKEKFFNKIPVTQKATCCSNAADSMNFGVVSYNKKGRLFGMINRFTLGAQLPFGYFAHK
ncbi:hypothetical protein B6D60_05815 [candidate division KSB1 bacterium 4484_87]|nr:MAG: hypothetical protein B6D60_05815 [candidate division KSB1 bacterium 4484_87]